VPVFPKVNELDAADGEPAKLNGVPDVGVRPFGLPLKCEVPPLAGDVVTSFVVSLGLRNTEDDASAFPKAELVDIAPVPAEVPKLNEDLEVSEVVLDEPNAEEGFSVGFDSAAAVVEPPKENTEDLLVVELSSFGVKPPVGIEEDVAGVEGFGANDPNEVGATGIVNFAGAVGADTGFDRAAVDEGLLLASNSSWTVTRKVLYLSRR
jgi:hypothetical protein